MKRTFYKYQGTGNDFILFDDREKTFNERDEELIAKLCDRRFGIGADGLMLLRNETGYDFRMVYVNADGKPSSMCGNGGRCISRFAADLGITQKSTIRFLAVDGPHEALIGPHTVKLKMADVENVEANSEFYFMNTGSPHYVTFSKNPESLDVVGEGRKVRYSDRFHKEGTNVNFAKEENGSIFVRTYERGVEDETLSCGTGVTAAALAASMNGMATATDKCIVLTRGGKLTVHFHRSEKGFSNIWLEGPATFVYKGEIEL